MPASWNSADEFSARGGILIREEEEDLPLEPQDGLNFCVGNKVETLEQVLADKLAQRSSGGAHEAIEQFKMMDKDGSGAIDREEMKDFLALYNIVLEEEHLELVFQKYDPDGDGISFFEFMHQVNPEDFPTKEEVEELFSAPSSPSPASSPAASSTSAWASEL